MHQSSTASGFQIIAWPAWRQTEQMLIYSQSNCWEQISMKLELKQQFSHKKINFKNVVCKLLLILSRSKWPQANDSCIHCSKRKVVIFAKYSVVAALDFDKFQCYRWRKLRQNVNFRCSLLTVSDPAVTLCWKWCINSVTLGEAM